MFEINLKGCENNVLIKVNGKNYERILLGPRFDTTKVKVPLNKGDEIAFHNYYHPCHWKGYLDVNHFMVIGTIYL